MPGKLFFCKRCSGLLHSDLAPHSALGAIRGILNAAQSMLEVEGGGRWKMVTLIDGMDENEGSWVPQVLPYGFIHLSLVMTSDELNCSVSAKTGLSSFTEDVIFSARQGMIRCLADHTSSNSTVIMPHSEGVSDNDEDDEVGYDEPEDEIERLEGVEDEEEDAEVFAGLVELSHLRKQHLVTKPGLTLTLANRSS